MAFDKPKASSTARGYGAAHQRARKQWAKFLPLPCTRCGKPVLPGMRWHLDHDDHDRTKYLGPAHAGCNTRAGARLGRSRQTATTLRW